MSEQQTPQPKQNIVRFPVSKKERRKLLREDTPSAERSESSLPEGSLDAALLNPGMLLFTVASFTMAGYVILYL